MSLNGSRLSKDLTTSGIEEDPWELAASFSTGIDGRLASPGTSEDSLLEFP